jgi:hypothetical protein
MVYQYTSLLFNKLTHHKTEATKVATPVKIVKIPTPEGTAGKDYNLQTMMKLGNDDRIYVAIRVGVIIYTSLKRCLLVTL